MPGVREKVLKQSRIQRRDLLIADLHELGWLAVEARNHSALFCYVEERPGAIKNIGNILVAEVDDRILDTSAVRVALGVITERPVNPESQPLNILELQVAFLQISDVLRELLARDPRQPLRHLSGSDAALSKTIAAGRTFIET